MNLLKENCFVCGSNVFLCSQVLVTVYWLGRKAQLDPFYCGPQLNFKAFEGLLGLALSKVRHAFWFSTMFVFFLCPY